MLSKENTKEQIADDQMDCLELAESVVGEAVASDISLIGEGIEEKAIFFVKTFVKEFEEKLSQCYEEVKPGSNMKKAGKFVDECKSILNDSIPPGPWKPALKKPGEYMGSFAAERHKEKEKKLYSAVLPLKDKQREVLVEAGLEVFQKFEKQFAQIIGICPLFSWKEEVLKLAIDAVSRARNYISNINEVEKFSVDLVTQGVVLGQSKESFPISYSKDQMEDDEEFSEASSTSLLYKKVGIKIIEGNTAKYYQLKGDSYGEKYGYRLLFAWESENWEEIKEKYVLSETPEEECLYILGDERKEKLASFILKEINGEDLVRQGYIDKCNKDYYERKIDMSCNFPDTPTHFIKRKKVIEELNTMFHSRSQEKEMSRVVLVSGKRGTGKSTLAGDYGFRERRKGTWTKITWINAFGHSNLKRSFSQLAKLLEIPTKIESKGGRERDIDIESTVNSIYEYFRYTRSFFVFDNANSYSEIERFLPANFPLFLNKEKPFILITSRESWKKEGIEEIELGGFDPKESDKFLQKLLKEDKSQDDISKLGKALNYHPFDLLHAAVNINQQGDSINSYLKRYKAMQKRSGLQDDEKSFGIVKINIDKIREEEKLAYAILEFMTYLNSYPINVKDFFFSGKSEENQQKIQYALGQLDSYSLIHLEKGIAQIHQTTQEFMRLRQEKEGKEKETLRKIIILLRNSNTTTTSHIISVWNHVSKYKKLVNDFVCLIYHEGSTILHLLAEGGNEEVIRLMLEKIDQDNLSEVINTTDKIGLTPIYYAIIDDHLEVVKYLIEKGAELIVNHESGIKCAAMSGSLKVVKYLIEEGYFKLDELGEHDETPLTYAIEFDRLSVIKYLIKKRAAVNSLNDEEILHLFYYAFEPGNLDIAQFLVRNLNGVNLRSEGGESLLHYAAMYGSSDTVEYLVQNSSNVNLPDHDGKSPLCYAVMSSDLDIVEYLIQNSANVNLPDHDGNSPLYYAAASGDLDIVKYLVQNGANVNSCDENITALLFDAVKDGNLDIVECLAEMEVDINQCDKYHLSPLYYAAAHGHLDIVKYLVQNGANVNSCDENITALLFDAVKDGNLNIVECLAEMEVDINQCDKYHLSPLYYAAAHGHLDIVKYLVKNVTNINSRDENIITLLFCAVKDGGLNVVKCFVEMGIDINQRNKHHASLLHYAAKNGRLNVVKFLIDRKADLNLQDKKGESPLHYAIQADHFNTARYLLRKGASFNLVDEDNHNPLYFTTFNNILAIFSTLWEEVDVTLFNNGISSLNLSNIEFLIKVGVNVNQYNKYDMNFLHYAAKDGHLGIVEYLIKKGANVNACGGRDDVKPLHYATKYGHLDVVEYLLNKGANVDACDKYGASPLHYAARMGHFNVVINLVNSKANINLCDESSRKPLHYSIENNHLNIAYFLRMQEDNVNPAYEQSQISIRKRLRASELQDCTLPCSVNGQCVSSKRRRLENVRATSLDNHEAVNSSLETTASLVALDFELQRTLSHYNDKMQRFTQLGNSDSRELQQPIDNSVPISSLSGIVIEPGNNTVSVQPSGIRDDKLLYWSH